MRFTWLFLRTRLAGRAACGVLAVAGGNLVWDDLIPADDGLLLAGATLFPLAAATVIGVTTHSPFGELERTASRPLVGFRFGQLAGLSLIAAIGLLLTAWGWPGAGEDWMLARNLAGFAGMALISAAVAGARFAWVVPLAFGLSTLFVNIKGDGSAHWAWTIQPCDNWMSLAVALALLVAGLVVVSWLGARDVADETV